MEIEIKQLMGTPPETLVQAIARGIQLIDENYPAGFDLDEDSFLGLLHHGFGQHMRNYWGLWSQDSGVYNEINKQFKLEHADDCSSIILYGIYRTKKGLTLDYEPIARKFHLHWKQYENNK